jgi:hypothetical protein
MELVCPCCKEKTERALKEDVAQCPECEHEMGVEDARMMWVYEKALRLIALHTFATGSGAEKELQAAIDLAISALDCCSGDD